MSKTSSCFNVLFAALVAFASLSARAQTTIAQWTFETFTAPSGAQTAGFVVTNIAAENGAGTAAARHAASVTYTAPSGNGSAKSISSPGWATGDYYQFAVSTVGQSGITLIWDQTGSNTGPKNHKLQYSTDAVNYTDIGTYVVTNGSWSPSFPTGTNTTYTNVLSAITAINNKPVVYFRLSMNDTTSINNGTVAAAGTCRVDNFTVIASGGGGEVPQYLSIQPNGTGLQISWTNAAYQLQSSTSVSNGYGTVSSSSPFNDTTNAGKTFYRLVK